MRKVPFKLSGAMRRYLIIGVSVYLFELLVIVAAQALGASSVLAVGISFWLGLIASFSLQKVITFGDKRLHYRVLLPQLIAYGLLVLFNFGFTIGLTKLLEDTLPAVWCRTLALAVTTLWNFYLYKTRIFNWKQPVKGGPKKRKAVVKQLAARRKLLMKRYRGWRSQPGVKRLREYVERPATGKRFMGFSLAVLFATTAFWGVLGAKLQQTNADQLINARLFDPFSAALLPDQHSFLIKWPLFYIIRLLEYSPTAILWVTLGAVLATVAAFAYVLWRIERRPLVFGSLCLMLASVLLLVPAQPYAGALLPVNMAMLATRNLEYILYVLSLILLLRAASFKSRQFIGGVALFTLLVASDRLFLSVSIVAALLALVCYAVRRQWDMTNTAARWLFFSGLAALAALLLIALINVLGITTIAGNQAGPYAAASGLKAVGLGVFFGVAGSFTNFGANPAYDATTFGSLPERFLNHLFSPAGPAYLINIAIFGLCAYAAIRLLLRSFQAAKPKQAPVSFVRRFALLLIWSSIAVAGLFIMADHYHQVDARYLTLCLFAGFVALAAWLRPRRVDAELVVSALPLLVSAIVCGVVGAVQTYSNQQQALDTVNYRDKIVAQTLANHHVGTLVGDYWRVLPIQAISANGAQRVLPLHSCTEPRATLTSEAWQPDLSKTSFAYLLSLDRSLTDYPQCDLEAVAAKYGVPNSSVLIDGSLAHPKEVLLFYDRGTHFPRTLSTATDAAEAILPVSLKDLPDTDCDGPAVMNIVAHQDDDLLFMNPDLQHAIDSGSCVRTIYLTAGDAGGKHSYWLSRALGSEAAYSIMTGAKAAWMDRAVRLPDGQYVTLASLRGNHRVSLIFMHLPDGNLDGRGFKASEFESLDKLETGRTKTIRTIDNQSHYSSDDLVQGLADLITAFEPAEIRTQSNYAGGPFTDHSDHRAVGRFAVRAAQQARTAAPITFYLGYPVHELPANVEGVDLRRKEAAFTAYGIFDKGVCRGGCALNPVYDIYLARQYHNPY